MRGAAKSLLPICSRFRNFGTERQNSANFRVHFHPSPDSADRLHRLLESNRGDTGVDVELYNPSDFRVNIQSSDFVKVKSSTELIRQIEGICGPGSVHVIN
jgi:hypothetical protein